MVLVSKSPNRLAGKPGYVPPQLGAQPSIHELAVVRDCELGQYTQVGPFTTMHDSSMGDYSYIVQNCQVMWSTIGRFTSIASYVRLNPGNHPTWRPTQHHFTYRGRSYGFSAEDDTEFFDWRKSHWTTVGHDVWIGHGATVMPGVKVGNGAVIGAGAVVTRDVEPYTVVAGVPARVIKRRFPAEIADTLERIAWWDWSRAELNEWFEDFKDLDQFLEKHG